MAGLLPHALLGDTAVGQQQLLAAWIITTTLNLVLFLCNACVRPARSARPSEITHRVDASAPKLGAGCTEVAELELKATDRI